VREADHSPPSSAEVKEGVQLYRHSLNTPSWRGAQLKKAQGQLYVYCDEMREDERGGACRKHEVHEECLK
jgi:hypothetical protein